MKKLFLVIILVFFSKIVYSNSLFNTSFYDVEFNSNNIEKDKIKEINKIKIKSFLSILKKTLSDKDYVEIHNFISDDLINTLIKNIVINEEKIINDKYFSKIKINFNKNKIIDLFRVNKIPYVEYYPDKFLLIFYEIDGINNNLFTKNNKYYQYYNNNYKKSKLFTIPNLDINDRFILKENDLINIDTNKILNFAKKYNSNENLIIIAETERNKIIYKLILFSDGNILEKIIENDTNDVGFIFSILENKTLNLWKQINQIQNISLNYLNCKIKYFNLFELKEIKNNLNKVSVIKNLTIKSLSNKNIKYDINYYGNLKILIKILQLNKLKLNYNNNTCIISLI